MLRHLIVSVLIFLGVNGCSETPILPPSIETNPKVVVLPQIIRWSSNIPKTETLWYAEAEKRFKNPILFICHGGFQNVSHKDSDGGQLVTFEWWIYPDAPRHPMSVQAAADTLADLYPDRDIVFIVCNELGCEIKTKHIWYAKQKVWVVPDDYVGLNTDMHETTRNFGSAGSIWEFVTYNGKDEVKDHSQIMVYPDSKPLSLPTTKQCK